MKGIKIILYFLAIFYWLGTVITFLPLSILTDYLHFVGAKLPDTIDVTTIFWFRLSGVGFGLAGIFYVILARNPLGYGVMLPFTAYGQICIGLSYFAWSIGYDFPLPAWYMFIESFLLVVPGVLLLVFRNKVIQTH